MKRHRWNLGALVIGLFAVQACDRQEGRDPASSAAESKKGGDVAGGSVEAIAGIYEIQSRVENTDACSAEGAQPMRASKNQFFFVAPDRSVQPVTKSLRTAGMIGSCETLAACNDDVRRFLSNGQATFSFGGRIKRQEDGTLEQADPFPRTSLNESPEDRCDMIWTRSTVTGQGTQVVYREEDHLVEFAKPEGHEACRIEGLERARAAPCGRLRVTTGKRVADLPAVARDDDTAASVK